MEATGRPKEVSSAVLDDRLDLAAHVELVADALPRRCGRFPARHPVAAVPPFWGLCGALRMGYNPSGP